MQVGQGLARGPTLSSYGISQYTVDACIINTLRARIEGVTRPSLHRASSCRRLHYHQIRARIISSFAMMWEGSPDECEMDTLSFAGVATHYISISSTLTTWILVIFFWSTRYVELLQLFN